MQYPMYTEPTESIKPRDLMDICYQGINTTFTVIKSPYLNNNVFNMDLEYSGVPYLSNWEEEEGRWKIIPFL